MKILSAVFLLASLTVLGSDPSGFAAYTPGELKAKVNAAKLDENKAGLARMATWGNHGLLMVRREGDGAVEVHDKQVDIVMVVSGAGTLVIGGTVVGGKTTAPGEIRGKSIEGGERHAMAAGDVFHIPAKVPHQMLVPQNLVIEVVKVDVP